MINHDLQQSIGQTNPKDERRAVQQIMAGQIREWWNDNEMGRTKLAMAAANTALSLGTKNESAQGAQDFVEAIKILATGNPEDQEIALAIGHRMQEVKASYIRSSRK